MQELVAAGIDLSGRTVGTTAVAWVSGRADERPAVIEVRAGRHYRGDKGDGELLAALQGRRPDVVAIDAPLTLPHPVSCVEPDCPICFPIDGTTPSYSTRTVEMAAAWRGVEHLEKPPMPMVLIAAIAFRAMYLKRFFERAGLRVIETWPMGVYRALARGTPDASGDTGPSWRRGVLATVVERLDRAGEDSERDIVDRLDAVAAGYAGWCALTGLALEVRDPAAASAGIWIPRGSAEVEAHGPARQARRGEPGARLGAWRPPRPGRAQAQLDEP